MAPDEDSRGDPAAGPQGHLPALRLRVFEQLKQRNVFRVALLYLVVCWLILEPVHVIFHMLDVPLWANRLVVMIMVRHYEEAVPALTDSISLDPDFPTSYAIRGLAYYGLGDLKSARASCETKPDYWASQQCLAVVYDKLGQHADAEAVLAKMKAANGDETAYQYAAIYAQWGDREKALEWVDTAMRLRDPGLVSLKTDPLMDSLRQEPRFQAVMRELKFPSD